MPLATVKMCYLQEQKGGSVLMPFFPARHQKGHQKSHPLNLVYNTFLMPFGFLAICSENNSLDVAKRQKGIKGHQKGITKGHQANADDALFPPPYKGAEGISVAGTDFSYSERACARRAGNPSPAAPRARAFKIGGGAPWPRE